MASPERFKIKTRRSILPLGHKAYIKGIKDVDEYGKTKVLAIENLKKRIRSWIVG